ncbi:hypothetical protein WCX49_01540 [Sulfurimonas sp. HSL-1656]|uniref:hypothetical protein n=1 Tax=Thiomicrolovo subterrani TaxID=3131934 RepID=UPI0031F8CA72
MILNHEARIEKAAALMEAFEAHTPFDRAGGRYLWTDAFAVCNYLSLFKRLGAKGYLDKARALIDAVHRELGTFRADDGRHGTLSGLGEADAAHYPTVAGLRIGKPLPERGVEEAYDETSEWDRDGQYFHYLTKWMHALDRMAAVSGEVRYSRWAVELAKSAHRAFTYTMPDGSKRMYWKMSTDLRRPLVASMGQHDALEAYVTYLQLSVTARALGDDAGLGGELEATGAMAETMPLLTDDPLGLGGLLFDATRVTQMMAGHDLPLRGLLRALLEAAREGTERFLQSSALRYPAEARLAFRELGLGIGLHGVSLMQVLNDGHLKNGVLAEQLGALQASVPMAEVLELFWLREAHQAAATWREHADINTVMLATSLLPDAFLTIGGPEHA